jgi:hypothetical protein
MNKTNSAIRMMSAAKDRKSRGRAIDRNLLFAKFGRNREHEGIRRCCGFWKNSPRIRGSCNRRGDWQARHHTITHGQHEAVYCGAQEIRRWLFLQSLSGARLHQFQELLRSLARLGEGNSLHTRQAQI